MISPYRQTAAPLAPRLPVRFWGRWRWLIQLFCWHTFIYPKYDGFTRCNVSPGYATWGGSWGAGTPKRCTKCATIRFPDLSGCPL